MKLLATLVLVYALQSDVDDTLSKLLARAEKIIDQTQSREIDTSKARRKVQLLLKDLEKWAEDNGVELVSRTRTFTTPARETDEPLTADRCPLFFEFKEKLKELCPLDLAHSEVWGGAVVFCRYQCVE